MDLDIKISKGVAAFVVSGAIDTEGGSELSTKFVEIAKDDSIREATFDLSGVPSITSAGIGKLLTFYKHFDKKGGGLRIVGVSDALRQQFNEIHLDHIIPIG